MRLALRRRCLWLPPIEFYQSFEELVAPRLTEMFQEAYRVGALPEDTCSGDIALLYKNGDARDPRNYKPITLLQTDYTKSSQKS
mmetsp:Transcript_874/g.1293  ORF Transcript_874/g.1293 Transcript_874/m.1293 type:complete len:84 (+) Transcript_874:287-538(+)